MCGTYKKGDTLRGLRDRMSGEAHNWFVIYSILKWNNKGISFIHNPIEIRSKRHAANNDRDTFFKSDNSKRLRFCL